MSLYNSIKEEREGGRERRRKDMMDKGGPSVEATVNEMHKEESSGNPSPEMREVNECPMGLSSISSDNPQCFPLCVRSH